MATTSQYQPATVVEYLTSRGHTLIATNNPKNKYRCACPLCGSDSFSINANRNQFNCFACPFHGAGIGAARKLLDDTATSTDGDISPAVKLAISQKNKKTRQIAKYDAKANQWQGATVKELCEAKGIDYEYATGTLGWKDTRYGRKHTPAVAMPYYGIDGQIIDTRFRVGISEGTRVVSRKGSSVMPYGLQNLDQYRSGRYVILQEGETDWATLDSLAYNAIGIPGVMAYKPEWTVYLNGINTVYVWQESGGKPDRNGRTPGQQMVHRISTYRGQVWVLEAPPEGKDPCELRQKLGDTAFMALLDQMMLDAKPYDATKLGQSSQPTKSKPSAIHIHSDSPPPNPTPVGHETWAKGSAFDTSSCQQAHKAAHSESKHHGKPVNLSTMAYRHRKIWGKFLKNRLVLLPMVTSGKTPDFCVYMDDMGQLIEHEHLVNLVSGTLGQVDMAGKAVAAYQSIVDCGRGASMMCDTHGRAWGSKHKCYQGFDPNCGTQASVKASRVTLPGLEGTASYYHVVLETRTQIPDLLYKWTVEFGLQLDAWQDIISKASDWKATKNSIYARSNATYYQQDAEKPGKYIAITRWKLLLHEPEEGCMAKAITKIAKVMGAVIVDERRWQAGTTATLQVVDDFMSHLVGIDSAIPMADQYKIFLGHYSATQGRHIFQAFSLFRQKIAALPAPEPQICPEPGCDLQLHEVLDPRLPPLPSERHRHKNGPN